MGAQIISFWMKYVPSTHCCSISMHLSLMCLILTGKQSDNSASKTKFRQISCAREATLEESVESPVRSKFRPLRVLERCSVEDMTRGKIFTQWRRGRI